MITLNQTIGNDADLLYFIKIYFDNNVYKICRENNILANYKANLIENTNININCEYVSFEKGFCFSDNIEIEIPRYLINDYLSDFQNSLYPATNKSQWLNRKVEIGIGWKGIYSENQITWIYCGFIKNYEYNSNSLRFTISSFIDDIEIPTELITSDEFPNCPEENLNKPKPIVFGKLDYCFLFYDDANNEKQFNYISLAPALLVDKNEGIYYISQNISHILPTDKKLHYSTSYIDNIVFIVFYENPNKYVAITNYALENNILNENYYAIKLRKENSTNNFRAFLKYKPLNEGFHTNSKMKNLFKRNAGYDYEIFGQYEKFSLSLDALNRDLFGYLENNNIYFVMHTIASSINNLAISIVLKENESVVGIIQVKTNNPKTYVSGLLPSENSENYELHFQVLANSLLYLRNFYFIGWDLTFNNRDLI